MGRSNNRRVTRRGNRTVTRCGEPRIPDPERLPVDVFANGQHFDPRMNLGIEDIKRQYPWLCSGKTVFR